VEKRPVVIPGFRFAGVACGIKLSGKKDLSLIVSDVPATAVAAFTTNRVKAAPVLVGQERVKAGRLQAVVVNSGNANVSTGQPGIRVALDSCKLVGRLLRVDENLVLPSSTGKIGVMPPWDKMRAGIHAAYVTLSPRGFWNAVAGIMTTDSFPKVTVRQVEVDKKTVTIAGMAKGAGMINPNMATMLCYVLTDTQIDRAALQLVLDQTLPDSFNAISVDGDTSTNDTVLLLANGMAGNREIQARGRDFLHFKAAVAEIMRTLARSVVKDGEGATRIVDIFVRGAKTPADAEKIARTIAYSPLVKTAFFGGDPNWGRIACAAGYAGVTVNPDKLDLAIGDVLVSRNGMTTDPENERQAALVMRQPEFSVTIDLHLGRGNAHIVTSDLSVGYVRFNSAYST
jgi:glutamate N-acetyltransferase/amino-acid N-acetyltransferase